jgi:hypothetical protein
MPRSRSTAIQSERTRRRAPRALTSPARQVAAVTRNDYIDCSDFKASCLVASITIRIWMRA